MTLSTMDPASGRDALPEPVAFRTTEAAAYLGTSPFALSARRTRGQGPRYIKRGRAVWYLKADLDAFLRDDTREDR